MLEFGFLMKIFGVGIVGAVADIVLKRMGKPDLALVLDILLIAGVTAVTVYKVKHYIDEIATMFGV